VPLVNWLLMIGCVGLVVGFRTSSALASAYGIAVTTTMMITTLLFYRVTRDRWGWSTFRAVATLTPLMAVDLAFLAANVPKIPTGGWFPLVVGFGLVIQMTTWRRGRELVASRIRRGERPMTEVGREALEAKVARVPGTAVYLFKDAGAAPPALVSNLEHNKVLHETTLLLSVSVSEVPRVDPLDRVTYTPVGPGIHQIELRFGFMDEPDVPDALAAMDDIPDYEFDLGTTTFFLGREAVGAGKAPGMHPWREELFVLLNRGAASASRFFNLPPDRVFEVGTQVEI
jgi:KUP system potassium uptake protein